jgi:hypothetical protein
MGAFVGAYNKGRSCYRTKRGGGHFAVSAYPEGTQTHVDVDSTNSMWSEDVEDWLARTLT